MGKINLTPDDMRKGMLYPEEWFKAEVVEAVQKVSKAGDSINYTATFRLENYSDGTHKVDRLFNSKGIGYMKPYLAALQNKPLAVFIEENKSGIEFQWEDTVGGKLQIKIASKRRDDNGELKSEVVDFAPYDYKIPF